ncbi:unnamed protein product, partial [marine sediment metagenome]
TVKSYLGITTTDFDAILTDLINGVSAAMEKHMRRVIVPTLVVGEFHDGSAERVLQLDIYPARGVTVTDTADASTLATTNYRVVENDGQLWRTVAGGSWSGGWDRWSVAYSGGFATVPYDLSMAAVFEVGSQFRKTGPGSEGTGSRLGRESYSQPDGFSESFFGDGFLPGTLQAMDGHKAAADL